MKCCMLEDGHFQTSTPEAQGIPSQAVLDFLDAVEFNQVDMHCLYIFRHGKMVVGQTRKPYAPDTLHRIYSAAKAITGAAMLFCLAEGRISLDAKIIDYFPNDLPEVVSDNLKELNLFHVLTMETGQDQDPFGPMLKSDMNYGNNAKAFFEVPFLYKPGTHFMYNNGVPHILGLLVKKLTGQNYVDYLKPRLFDPLDMYCTVEFNNNGEKEGSSTVITPEGLAKLTLFYLQEGMWNGKQLIDPKWVRMAGEYQGPSGRCNSISFPNKYQMYGYGFQTWRCSEGGFRLDGGRCQYGYCSPDNELAICVMDIESDSAIIHRIVSENLYKKLQDGPIEETDEVKAVQDKLKKRLEDWSCMPKLAPAPEKLEEYYDKRYVLEENMYGLTALTIHFSGTGNPSVVVEHGDEKAEVVCGVNGDYIENPSFVTVPHDNFMLNMVYNAPSTWAVSGGWPSDYCFVFQVRERGWMNFNTYYCRFNKGKVSLYIEPNVAKLANIRTYVPTGCGKTPAITVNGHSEEI